MRAGVVRHVGNGSRKRLARTMRCANAADTALVRRHCVWRQRAPQRFDPTTQNATTDHAGGVIKVASRMVEPVCFMKYRSKSPWIGCIGAQGVVAPVAARSANGPAGNEDSGPAAIRDRRRSSSPAVHGRWRRTVAWVH